MLNTADKPINLRLCIRGVFIKEAYRTSKAGREMMSFNRMEDGRLASLILEKGIQTEHTGIRAPLLSFSISMEASASVNTLKCFVAVRNIDL